MTNLFILHFVTVFHNMIQTNYETSTESSNDIRKYTCSLRNGLKILCSEQNCYFFILFLRILEIP